MINEAFRVVADDRPYQAACQELRSLIGEIDNPLRARILEFVNHAPDDLLINLINVPTGAHEITVLVQPTQTFFILLEAVRTRHIDDAFVDRLLVHQSSLLAGVVTPG
jgi:hypothetical protein